MTNCSVSAIRSGRGPIRCIARQVGFFFCQSSSQALWAGPAAMVVAGTNAVSTVNTMR